MRKVFKMVGIASIVVIILAISIGSVVMAAGPNPNPGNPNPDCPYECPNPDCPYDGSQMQCQNQNGPLGPNGGIHKYQYRYGQAESITCL